MAKTQHYYTVFEEGNVYHIYNRTVDKQPMFKNEGNYEFFLRKYDEYMSPFVETYAYSLLGNHFHLLVRIKEELVANKDKDLTTFQKLSNLNSPKVRQESSAHDIVSHQFRKFFQSYGMAFNKQQTRVGTLFQTPFKRVLVNNDTYFTQLIYYIHCNAQKHGLIENFRDWKWSSYNGILLEKPTKLKRHEVLEWFGDKDAYKQYHALLQKTLLDEKFFIEDDQ
jgi:putative transposase